MFKNKIKMTALVFALTITSMFVASKKSEAGILLITSATGGVATIGWIAAAAGTPGTLISIPQLFSSNDFDRVFGLMVLIPSALVLILDADGTLPSGQLVTEFSKKYAFIENREVIENLVSGIKEKAGKLSANEKKYVSFNSSEVDTFLSSMDTTGLEKEIAQMKKDLE